MSTPVRVAVACVFVVTVYLARPAEACSCASPGVKRYMADATRVFIAEVLPAQTRGSHTIQTLRIVHTLKGVRTATFSLKRGNAVGMCEAVLTAGEVRLVFVRGQRLSTCAGNYAFSWQRRIYAQLLALGTPRVGVADKQAVRLALERALGGYLHKRTLIQVVYPPLASHNLKLGGTQLMFLRTSTSRAAVVIEHAVKSGPVQFISGTFAAEGVSFAVLIHRPTLKVLNKYVVERK